MKPVARFTHLMDAFLAGAAGYRTPLKAETRECRELVAEGLLEEHDTPNPHFLLTRRGADALVNAGAIFPVDLDRYFLGELED